MDSSRHHLILGISANLFDKRLQLKGNATYSMNHFGSKYRPVNSDGLSFTYILPYGQKTDSERVNTENKINSAILRPF